VLRKQPGMPNDQVPARSRKGSPRWGDRGFASGSLQRRVRCELDAAGSGPGLRYGAGVIGTAISSWPSTALVTNKTPTGTYRAPDRYEGSFFCNRFLVEGHRRKRQHENSSPGD
jgi:hypothetical protein